MKTYLIRGTKKAFVEAEKVASRWQENKDRAIALYNGDAAPLGVEIVRVTKKDDFALLLPWIRRTVLDDLHETFVDASPIEARAQSRAVSTWAQARAARVAAEKNLVQVKERELRASIRIVETHGKGPVEIDGVLYDPGFSRTTVFLSARKAP